jgi:hypothetical protein
MNHDREQRIRYKVFVAGEVTRKLVVKGLSVERAKKLLNQRVEQIIEQDLKTHPRYHERCASSVRIFDIDSYMDGEV